MTQIGVAVVDIPEEYRYSQYGVVLGGAVDRDEDLHSMRELFALCRTGTAIHNIPGRRPIGEDMDEELRNTQYVQFSHGDRPITGWYLLRSFSLFQDETPMGADRATYAFTVDLFFLGTVAYYVAGFALKDLEAAVSDWGI
ncbi:MAG TPA: hypothetical protein VMW50_03200 [Dehalococcoidia bacterium]|nr:hypothetical protein [Dehalococcoidia bacterium]